jgi:hypothetical protein
LYLKVNSAGMSAVLSVTKAMLMSVPYLPTLGRSIRDANMV